MLSRHLAEFFNDPGRFTAFVGWEYTLHTHPGIPTSKDSHRSVIFQGSDGPVFPCFPENPYFDKIASSTAELVRFFQGHEVLLHHHHPHEIVITDDTLECNIEVTSGWRYSMNMPHYVENLHHLLGQGYRLG